jgi:uncharacterized protein (TIGR03067 family)
MALLIGLLPIAAASPQEETIKKEVKDLQGTWVVIGAEQDGKPLDRIKGGKMLIKDENFTINTKSGTEMKGDLRIDPSKKPKTMDLVHQEGLLRDKTWQAIYSLEGDELKICYVDPDAKKDRPGEFTAEADSGRLLVILKREKP